MFTVEFDHDEVCITLVDDFNNHEDVIVNSFDDIVFIRQWNPITNKFTTISMGPAQWEDFIASINSKEGAFVFVRE